MEVMEVTQAATLTPWLHTLISGAMLLFGALLGSLISGLSSYPMVFLVTGITLLINLLLVLRFRTRQAA